MMLRGYANMLQGPPHESQDTLLCKVHCFAFMAGCLPVAETARQCIELAVRRRSRVRIFASDHARTTTMPWTFAHPAAVLPLRKALRSRLSFCALVVGSMSPDFP